MKLETGRYSDDPRLDKMYTWGWNILAVSLLAIGGWFFKGMSTSMDGLQKSVHDLKTEVAVMRAERKGETALQGRRIHDLEMRVTSLENR